MAWPIAFVQEKVANTTATSITATFDSTPTSGHAIIVSIGWEWFGVNPNAISSVVDSAGNTYTQAGNDVPEVSVYCSSRIYYAYNITGQASHSVTVTFASSVICELNITEWSGISFSHTPCESAAAKASSILNDPPYDADIGTVTATMDGALYMASWRTYEVYTIDAEPSGFTKLTDATAKLTTYYLIQDTAAAVSPVTSYTGSKIYSASVVVFVPEHHESPPAGGPLPSGAHPAGTITFRQQAIGSFGGSDHTDLVFVTTPKAGSLMLVAVSWLGSSIYNQTVTSVTDTAGNTYQAAGAVSSYGTTSFVRCQYWYAYDCAVTTLHTVTATMSAAVSTGYAHVSEWTGVDTASDPLLVFNSNANVDGWTPYTHSPGEVIPTDHHALIVAMFRSGATPSYTAPAGMTALTANNYLLSFYDIQNDASAFTPTLTNIGASKIYVSQVVVFRAIDAATDPPDSPLPFPTPETPVAQPGIMPTGSDCTLTRTTGALGSGTNAFTLMCWSKLGAVLWWEYERPSYDYWYSNLGDAGYMEAEANGVGVAQDHEYISDDGAWYHSALVYDGTTLTHYVTHEDLLTFDAAVAATITATMPAYSGGVAELTIDRAIKYFRVWSAALSVAEIKAECRSATVVKTASLYSNIPYTDASDTADLSGNGNEWTIAEPIAAYVPDFVVPTTPTAIATLPYTAVADAIGYGNDWEAWFAYTAVADEMVVGWLSDPVITGNLYAVTAALTGAKADPYYAPWSSSFQGAVSPSYGRGPLEIPVRSGQTYYFRVKNGNVLDTPTPIDTDAPISLLTAPDETIPAGAILITDDMSAFPCAFLSGDDGSVLGFAECSVADKGVALPNGYFCMQTSWGEGPRPAFVTMYDDQLNVVAAPDVDAYCYQISHNGNDTFYISTWLWPGLGISTLKTDGTFAFERWTVPATAQVGFAPAWDDSVIYYYERISSSVMSVRSFDLTTEVDSELFQYAHAYGAFGYTTDLIVLADGSLIVCGADTNHVARYSAAGVLLNTYGPFVGLKPATATLNRMAAGVDDPQDLWIWMMDGYGYSTFFHINVDDGTEIASFGRASWTAGKQKNDNAPYYPTTVDERFGHSNCCSIIVTKQPLVPSASASSSPSASPSPEPPRLIRRLRQSPHLSDEQVTLFFAQFQLDVEAGTPRDGIE